MKNDITAISIANYLIEEYEVNNLYLQNYYIICKIIICIKMMETFF